MVDRRRTNRNNRERGKAFEKRFAAFMGWWRVPFSGAAEDYGLADVRDHEDQSRARYMAECKTMTPRSARETSFIIKEKWLIGKDSVIERARRQGNKLPLLVFTKARSPKTFVIIRDEDFKMFTEALDVLRKFKLIDDTTDVDSIREQIGGLLYDPKDNTN